MCLKVSPDWHKNKNTHTHTKPLWSSHGRHLSAPFIIRHQQLLSAFCPSLCRHSGPVWFHQWVVGGLMCFCYQTSQNRVLLSTENKRDNPALARFKCPIMLGVQRSSMNVNKNFLGHSYFYIKDFYFFFTSVPQTDCDTIIQKSRNN